MQLFLIFAVPVSYLYFVIITGQSSASPSLLSRPIAKGAAFSIIVLAAVAILRRFVSVSEAGFVYYLVTSLKDMWVPTMVLFGFYAWTTNVRDQPSSERQTALRSFLVGGFSVLSFFDLFLPAGFYSAYDLFLLPTVRISLVLLLPSLFYFFSDTVTWRRYVILVGLIAVPFAFGFVFLLQAANYFTWAVVVALALLAGSAWIAIVTTGGVRSLRY